MSFSLIPEFRLSSFREVDADFLEQHNVRGILLDIDNTLEPYENPVPTEELLLWFSMLQEHGVRAAFVSNNGASRVTLFNRDLQLPAYPRAWKPLKRSLLRAMEEIGTAPEQTIFMGDQIYTDVFAAHNAGLRAILVNPIRDRRDPITFVKRLLERPVLRAYEKRNLSK